MLGGKCSRMTCPMKRVGSGESSSSFQESELGIAELPTKPRRLDITEM
jgi:hypothetical protein